MPLEHAFHLPREPSFFLIKKGDTHYMLLLPSCDTSFLVFAVLALLCFCLARPIPPTSSINSDYKPRIVDMPGREMRT